MADERDASLSPLTSPRSRSPRSRTKANGTASSHSPVLYSPLRAAHSASDGSKQHQSSRPSSVRFTSSPAPYSPDGSMAAEDERKDHLSRLTKKVSNSGSPVSPHTRRASDGFLSAHENDKPVESGSTTPPGRRSVQFARDATDMESTEGSRSRPASLGGEKGRTPSLYSKLKAFAAAPNLSSHSRSASSATIGGASTDGRFLDGHLSQPSEGEEPRFPFPATVETVNEEGSDIDGSSALPRASSSEGNRWDIGAAVRFLTGGDARWMTGVILPGI